MCLFWAGFPRGNETFLHGSSAKYLSKSIFRYLYFRNVHATNQARDKHLPFPFINLTSQYPTIKYPNQVRSQTYKQSDILLDCRFKLRIHLSLAFSATEP